jgi:hypothetical protein
LGTSRRDHNVAMHGHPARGPISDAINSFITPNDGGFVFPKKKSRRAVLGGDRYNQMSLSAEKTIQSSEILVTNTAKG